MDFAALTGTEVDALEGPQREAWYAWRRGDQAKADAILDAYGLNDGPPAQETPERAAEAPETPERKPAATRTRKRA